MLHIFNTIKKNKEKFIIENNIVNIYVCGITAYSDCHIGHARTFIFFDLVIRYLKYIGYKVNYVRNITDVDDKIIIKSKINNIPFYELTSKVINNMDKNLKLLNLIKPNYEPKITDHINYIIYTIDKLIKKGHVYKSSNGDLVFSIKSFKDYGVLSNININFLKKNKLNYKNNIDFVVWKLNSEYPSWDSPWGKGRPGWHIECSAISRKFFYNSNITIHGGGIDLIFPHHENEIAQSYCAFDNFKINYWMHVGSVIFFSEKMSKSLDNNLSLNYIFNYFHPEIVRYFLIMKHYRSPINYNENKMIQAKLLLNKLYLSINNIYIDKKIKLKKTDFTLEFNKAINDDFNVSKALQILSNIAYEINKFKKRDNLILYNLVLEIKKLSSILGILQVNPSVFLNKKYTKDIKDIEINLLIKRRNLARNNKNWKLADKIRYYLKNKGIILEDSKNKTYWKKI